MQVRVCNNDVIVVKANVGFVIHVCTYVVLVVRPGYGLV